MAEQTQPQIVMLQRMVSLSEKLTSLSEERSEMSEVRSYYNAERTLAVWVRTALTLMILGSPSIASDCCCIGLPAAPTRVHSPTDR